MLKRCLASILRAIEEPLLVAVSALIMAALIGWPLYTFITG